MFRIYTSKSNKEIEFYGVRGAFFDSDKNFTSGISYVANETVKTVTTPGNASYICININSTDSLGKTYLVELLIHESDIETGINLFDSSKAVLSGYYDNSNGKFIDSTEYRTSAFIKVNPGIKISHNGILMGGWNKNKQIYGTIINDSTIPNSVDFITVSFKLNEINNLNINRSK